LFDQKEKIKEPINRCCYLICLAWPGFTSTASLHLFFLLLSSCILTYSLFPDTRQMGISCRYVYRSGRTWIIMFWREASSHQNRCWLGLNSKIRCRKNAKLHKKKNHTKLFMDMLLCCRTITYIKQNAVNYCNENFS
jgi:hypothetical protein